MRLSVIDLRQHLNCSGNLSNSKEALAASILFYAIDSQLQPTLRRCVRIPHSADFPSEVIRSRRSSVVAKEKYCAAALHIVMKEKDKERRRADMPTDIDPGAPTPPDVIDVLLAMLRARTT